MQASNPNLPRTIPMLIGESLRSCDPELRQVLMGNIVLTGGGTLLAGFGDRLSNELSRNFTHVRGASYYLCNALIHKYRSKSTRQVTPSSAGTAVG